MKAKKMLTGKSDLEILESDDLFGSIPYVRYQSGDSVVLLKGDFCAAELRAIARYIDKHTGYLKQYEKRTEAKGKGQ